MHVYNSVYPEQSINRIVRIAYNAVNPVLRGKQVSIVGIRGATSWDGSRVIVRLIERDGSLGEEYLVKPSLIID